ncbi:unnamed protein product [Vitrella brassicaformis CCMP3155]|uniref:GST N-terminal domain-containing protein n=1 Tax=Vitrella brassicaformis (strain CCMP3155) TaxID=1169540 RepID=A0A0G4FL07_VITBC|nr:unnamed protein product [Vitrella brassicaformis CCMP3155]|eukprot:CEM14659.1 unnamed protein product [Vitrella brassicaformis CCMP3155]
MRPTDPTDEPNHEPPGFISSPRVMFIARWLELLWGYGVTRFGLVFTGFWVMMGGRWAVQAHNLVLKWVFGVTSPPKPIDGKHHLNHSHFCDKARWALDASGVAYSETAYGTSNFKPAITAVSHGTYAAAPYMVAANGASVPDSTGILTYLAEHHGRQASWLFPNKEATDLGKRRILTTTLRLCYGLLDTAPSGRLLVLCVALHTELCRSLKAKEVPHRAAVDEAFAKVEALLADGRQFLADHLPVGCWSALQYYIAFAPAAFPLVLPPEMSHHWVSLGNPLLPPAYRQQVLSRRATPAGQFVLKMYRELRQWRYDAAT